MNGADRASHRKVWFVVFLVLLVADLGLRLFETSVSGNAREMSEFELQAESIRDSDQPSVVFVGNSLFGNALLRGRLKNELALNGKSAEVFVADASNIFEWYCIIDDILDVALKPGDTLLIGFAWDQVADQTVLNMSRTFGLLCPGRYLKEYSNLGHPVGIGAWLELGLIKASKIYTYREALRNKALGFIIPGYEAQIQLLNQNASANSTTSEAAEFSFRTIRSLADKLAQKRISLSLVAMPVIDNYHLAPELCGALDETSVTVIDLRSMDQIGPADFRDPIHLDEGGAKVFTHHVAKMLEPGQSSKYQFCDGSL